MNSTSIEEIRQSLVEFPTRKDWSKIVEWGPMQNPGFGSKVDIVFGGIWAGYVDRGYLTKLPDMDGDWDEVGIVHYSYIDGYDERPIDRYESLYTLCKSPIISKIRIGDKP